MSANKALTVSVDNGNTETAKTIDIKDVKKIVEKDKAERVNLFNMIAYLLKSLRESLEKQDAGYNEPKWVRIVRIRNGIEFAWNDEEKQFEANKDKTSFLAKTTIASSSYLVMAIAEMQRYTFKGEKFLTEMDSLVALLQVMLSLIRSMTSDAFVKPVVDLLELNTKENPLKVITPGLDIADKFLRLVPRPEDLNVIKQELYHLLVIEYTKNSENKNVIDIDKSGKIRVMQLAFMQSYNLYGFKPVDAMGEKIKVTLLGTSINGNAIEASKYKKSGGKEDSSEFQLIEPASNMLNEANKEIGDLLAGMSYSGAKDESIKKFKLVNGLDEPTDPNVNAQVINLLMGVDVKYKTLREPKHLNAKTQEYIKKIENFNDAPNSNITAMQIPNRGDTAEQGQANKDVWDNEGFPDHHIAAFMQVANEENCIIMTRTPGKACLTVLEEGYDAKSFHIKAKSCQSGVAAGFLCLDPLLNKGGDNGALGNLLSNHKSLDTPFETSSSGIDYKSTTTPLMLSNDRINWLNNHDPGGSGLNFVESNGIYTDTKSEFKLLKSNVSRKNRKGESVDCYYVFHQFDSYKTHDITVEMLNNAIGTQTKDLDNIIKNEDNVLVLQDEINTFNDYEAVLKGKIRELEKMKDKLADAEDKGQELKKKEEEIAEANQKLADASQSRQDKLGNLKACLNAIKEKKNDIQTALLKDSSWEKSINKIGAAFTNNITSDTSLAKDKKIKQVQDGKDNVNHYFIYHFIIDTLTHKLRLLTGNNAWRGEVKDEEIKGYFPLLAMTNPYLCYQGEDYYLNAVVGDYDLFAIWPLEAELSDDDTRLIDIIPSTKKEDIFDRENKTTQRIRDQRGGSTTGTAVGNISMRVQFVGNLINAAIADGPQSSMINRVFHSDEGGRPGINEVDTAVAFTPYHKAYYLPDKIDSAPNGAEFLKFACFARSKKFAVLLNNGWIASLNAALGNQDVKKACKIIYNGISNVNDVGKDVFATWLGKQEQEQEQEQEPTPAALTTK